jgi:hypothetical protein
MNPKDTNERYTNLARHEALSVGLHKAVSVGVHNQFPVRRMEACERNPTTDDFELGYEQALHDTMVDLLRCHMLANLPLSPHADHMAPQDS